MAYRVNAQFRDGSISSAVADVVGAPSPRRGDTIAITRHGQSVPMLVIATWTPLAKLHGDGLIMVEAREI